MKMLGRRDARWKAGVAVATASFALAGALAFTVNPSGAGQGGQPKAFGIETDKVTYPSFAPATLSDLSPQCPQGIAATPGSLPSNKFLNPALNDANSFKAGGVVHYSYIDNPNFASENYTIQDCVAVYPESTFQSSDFDKNTGVLLPGANVTKSDLNSGVQVDGAQFSGVLDSTGSTYFNWTAPNDLTGGQWVCNFARDISTGHGGGGNRKVLPSCYQVPKPPVVPGEPTKEVGACGKADQLTIPSVQGVTYYLDGNVIASGVHDLATGAHTVVAKDANQQQIGSWPFTGSAIEAPEDCKTPVTPTAVTLSQACGRVDRYTVPTDADVTYVTVTGSNPETLTPIAAGTYDLPQGSTVKVRAVLKDAVNDKLSGTSEWTFTGGAISACSQTPPPPQQQVEPATTTTTEAPTTTTTSLPELPFTPEPEVVTTTTMAPAPELAFTGSNTGYLTMMGLVLVGFGGLLFAGSNRKRRTSNS
ncbi:MAG: hypothetical protein V7636_13 [Actinomycetota bacterium]|jgi:hypothetical protein